MNQNKLSLSVKIFVVIALKLAALTVIWFLFFKGHHISPTASDVASHFDSPQAK